MKNIKMIGSSIFQQWGIPNWGDVNVFNDAISGTTTSFWAENIKEYISSNICNYAVYCGSNDLSQGISTQSIMDNLAIIFDAIKSKSRKYQVAYFSIMKCPQKRSQFEIINKINTVIKQELSEQDIFIDINSVINQDLKWYIEDQIHLKKICYVEIESKFGHKIDQWAV